MAPPEATSLLLGIGVMPLVPQPLIAATPFGSFCLGSPSLSPWAQSGSISGPSQLHLSHLGHVSLFGQHKSLSTVPSFQTPSPCIQVTLLFLALLPTPLYPPWPRPWAHMLVCRRKDALHFWTFLPTNLLHDIPPQISHSLTNPPLASFWPPPGPLAFSPLGQFLGPLTPPPSPCRIVTCGLIFICRY